MGSFRMTPGCCWFIDRSYCKRKHTAFKRGARAQFPPKLPQKVKTVTEELSFVRSSCIGDLIIVYYLVFRLVILFSNTILLTFSYKYTEGSKGENRKLCWIFAFRPRWKTHITVVFKLTVTGNNKQ